MLVIHCGCLTVWDSTLTLTALLLEVGDMKIAETIARSFVWMSTNVWSLRGTCEARARELA